MEPEEGNIKDEIISTVYYDRGGHGSMKKTYYDAHKMNNIITEADVKDWFYKNTQRKKDLPGYNSFITSKPREEYQMDLMFFADMHDRIYEGGVIDGGYLQQIYHDHTYKKSRWTGATCGLKKSYS